MKTERQMSAARAVEMVASLQPLRTVFNLAKETNELTGWSFAPTNIAAAVENYRSRQPVDQGVGLYTIHNIGYVLLTAADVDQDGYVWELKHLVEQATGIKEAEIVQAYEEAITSRENFDNDYSLEDLQLLDQLMHCCYQSGDEQGFKLVSFFSAGELYILAQLISGGGYATFGHIRNEQKNSLRVGVAQINRKLSPYQLTLTSVVHGQTDYALAKISD